MSKAELIDEALVEEAEPFFIPSEPPDLIAQERHLHVLRVTPEDIGRGVPGDSRHCAIARCFSRWCDEHNVEIRDMSVTGGHIEVVTPHGHYGMKMPSIGSEFIGAFDNRVMHLVRPIQIPLDPQFVEYLLRDHERAKYVAPERPTFVEQYSPGWAEPPKLKIDHYWDVQIKPKKELMFMSTA